MLRQRAVLNGLLVIIIIVSVGCGQAPQKTNHEDVVGHVAFTMGTVVQLTAHGPDASSAVQQAEQLLDTLSEQVDRFIEQSDIAKVNEQAGEWVHVSPDTVQLVQAAIDWAEKTDGLFDPTIGPLVDLWGFVEVDHTDEFGEESAIVMQGQKPPPPEDIENARRHIHYGRVALDAQQYRIKVEPHTVVDLGGIAKGYAADRVADVFKEADILSALIDLGGDMYAVGTKPDGSHWRIGVLNPRRTNEIMAVITVADEAIVTSGDYERYFEYEGKRYTHLLNPKTGYPATHLASATIVAPTATAADSLATAVSVMDVDAALHLLQSLSGVEGLLIDTDLQVHMTPGMQERVTLQSDL